MEQFKNYGGGKLFEPKSLLENDNVAGVGYGVLGEKWDYTWLHIGVHGTNLTWAYDSDGSNISFVPVWSSNSNPHNGSCIVFGANSWLLEYGQDTGDWYVESCTSYSNLYDFMSVCESLLNK